ncbi:response regulator transcription factor [Carboxylicivirga linearis]|uniref:Response regulator transcription factor n=1 Tax=Carboxylicivirga linearis TaxID=1628157 RepID=A0ABS5JSN1_9BACT|nr:response regulator transcription factor [Carboxylicivirga linearis]MBS2097862.1 response regulator transcription factor [Carboxylicivirga linearis]
MTSHLKTYLVDDHVLFREGIRFLLAKWSQISEIHEADNGLELINKVETVKPDIILMDIDMPEMNGIDATRKTLQILPDCKILALSMHTDECFYKDMIDAGAKGFLLKNSRFEELQKAIVEIVKGNNFFSPEILSSILKNMNKPDKNTNTLGLTEREAEVLIQICKGLQNKEIADILFLSKRTIDKHRQNILLKTECRNTAELVVYAIKNGYYKYD